VCPKCRQHVQIIEKGKKTLKCQNCGTLLQTHKLRIFYSSESLEDSVLFRTRLQAEISGKGNHIFSLASSSYGSDYPSSDSENSVNLFELPQKGTSSNLSPKKDPKSLILEILKTMGGKIEKKELQQKALEKGITPEKFEKILKNLLETGEIYSPQPGILKIV
jgi:hypothetical protein